MEPWQLAFRHFVLYGVMACSSVIILAFVIAMTALHFDRLWWMHGTNEKIITQQYRAPADWGHGNG